MGGKAWLRELCPAENGHRLIKENSGTVGDRVTVGPPQCGGGGGGG